MLTGQETVSEICERSSKAAAVLRKYGITVESAEHLRYKNLAHAAIVQKISLRKILDDLAAVTGEAVAEVKVSGIEATGAHGSRVRKGGLENIKRIIAVHSGKGGVGKTFVAVNLASALASAAFAGGLRVGLLDADVDCPNVLHLLRMQGKLLANEQKMIVPLEKFGMKIVSMAPLLDSADDALLWRGPIVSRVLEQFLYDVAWGDLDVLIVDLPPGTSDIPLTLYSMLPRTEVIIVTTPHELGILDARKAAAMAKKCGVKILGLVENMTGAIFGTVKKDIKKTSNLTVTPVLARIPLRSEFAQFPDDGKPCVLTSLDLKKEFKKIRSRITYSH